MDALLLQKIAFREEETLGTKDLLTSLSKWDYSGDYLERKGNEALGDYLLERFGQLSARLSDVLGLDAEAIAIEGASLRAEGFEYFVTFVIDADDKKRGTLVHEIQVSKSFAPDRIPLLVAALGMDPSELRVFLPSPVEPLKLGAGLRAAKWKVTSQLAHKLEAEHPSRIRIVVEQRVVTFRGFSPAELWGEGRDAGKSSAWVGVLGLLG